MTGHETPWREPETQRVLVKQIHLWCRLKWPSGRETLKGLASTAVAPEEARSDPDLLEQYAINARESFTERVEHMAAQARQGWFVTRTRKGRPKARRIVGFDFVHG
jgi:hypothetical protein